MLLYWNCKSYVAYLNKLEILVHIKCSANLNNKIETNPLVSPEQSLNTGDHMLLISILNALITWSCLFYLLCDYGELLTDAFEELNRSIFDISWYACSADAQKMVLMMVRTSQQAVRLKGYGSINCSRDMFKQVNAKMEMLAFSTRRMRFIHTFAKLQVIPNSCSMLPHIIYCKNKKSILKNVSPHR